MTLGYAFITFLICSIRILSLTANVIRLMIFHYGIVPVPIRTVSINFTITVINALRRQLNAKRRDVRIIKRVGFLINLK